MHRTLRFLAVEILLSIGGARKEHALIANYDIGEERQHEPLAANVTGNHSPRLFLSVGPNLNNLNAKPCASATPQLTGGHRLS